MGFNLKRFLCLKKNKNLYALILFYDCQDKENLSIILSYGEGKLR